jgi:3-oxoacyl-[acyl-carrier-protein] synthase-3
MFILGIGAAHPDVEITDEVLVSFGIMPTDQEARSLARFGVRSRRASLPLEYIKDTKNNEVLEGRPLALATPTSLAVAASRQALERAGITPDKVGLILADTATPYQTCPSEAQRLGCALGVKIPAYDVVVGAASLPLYLEMLSSWKPERIPDYVLCVSTNTFSQHVAYGGSSALPAYLYGDAASAFVISPRHVGKMKITSSFVESSTKRPASSVVERHVSCPSDATLSTGEIVEKLSLSLGRIASTNTPSKVVGPQLYAGEFGEYEKALGLAQGSMISGTRDVGYALGASAGVALSSLWDSARAGDAIAVLHAGDGAWGGSVVVAAE